MAIESSCPPFWRAFNNTVEIDRCPPTPTPPAFVFALAADFDSILLIDGGTGGYLDYSPLQSYAGWDSGSTNYSVFMPSPSSQTNQLFMRPDSGPPWHLINPVTKTATVSPVVVKSTPSSNGDIQGFVSGAASLVAQTELSNFSTTPDDLYVADISTGSELWRKAIPAAYPGWIVGSSKPAISPDGSFYGVSLKDGSGYYRVAIFDAATGSEVTIGPQAGTSASNVSDLKFAQDSDGGTTKAVYKNSSLGGGAFQVIDIQTGQVTSTINSIISSEKQTFPIGDGKVAAVGLVDDSLVLAVRDLHSGSETTEVLVSSNVGSVQNFHGVVEEDAPIIGGYTVVGSNVPRIIGVTKTGQVLFDVGADTFTEVNNAATIIPLAVVNSA